MQRVCSTNAYWSAALFGGCDADPHAEPSARHARQVKMLAARMARALDEIDSGTSGSMASLQLGGPHAGRGPSQAEASPCAAADQAGESWAGKCFRMVSCCAEIGRASCRERV